jgi:ubiquinone/menaquinone biosynthesis C-methylase UbiE
MAREIAAIVGPRGKLFVTEMAAAQREALAAIARDEGLPQMVVVEAQAEATNLPSACCSAVYMRHVLHHIDNWPRYAVDLARTVQPGGIVAVIDFAPGALPHLTADHGAGPDRVVEAFAGVGLRLTNRDDNWGGGTYLLAFRRPE